MRGWALWGVLLALAAVMAIAPARAEARSRLAAEDRPSGVEVQSATRLSRPHHRVQHHRHHRHRMRQASAVRHAPPATAWGAAAEVRVLRVSDPVQAEFAPCRAGADPVVCADIAHANHVLVMTARDAVAAGVPRPILRMGYARWAAQRGAAGLQSREAVLAAYTERIAFVHAATSARPDYSAIVAQVRQARL